jgi:hypothetical protein
MSFTDLLRREAARMAETLKKGLPNIIDEKGRLERSQPQAWHAARLALLAREERAGLSGPERLAAYTPDTTINPECPYCWMLEGRHMPLKADPRSPGTVACPHCGGRYIEWF